MENEKKIMDNYVQAFGTLEDLVKSADEQHTTDIWQRTAIRDIVACPIKGTQEITKAIPDGTPDELLAAFIGESNIVLSYAVEENVQEEPSTGLCYEPVPVHSKGILRPTALSDVFARAKISGEGLRVISTEELTSVLNTILPKWGKEALMLIRYGKITAVHSGAAGGYVVLPIPELLRAFQEKLDEKFSGYVFEEGFETHSFTAMRVSLPKQAKGLLDTYNKALIDAGKAPSDMCPSVVFYTSDTADSAATLAATLKDTRRNDFNIRIGSPIRTDHRVGSSVEQFRESVDGLFAQFTDGTERLVELLKQKIYYPKNCMYAIAKEVSLSKKYVQLAVDEFVALNGEGEACAHDLYYTLGEAICYAKNADESQSKLLEMEEALARSLFLNWKSFDHA